MRGEFIRADGLVIPNNITTYGAKMIFRFGLIGDSYALHMGLANCNPDPLLDASALNEPTIGTHGYARQVIPQGGTGWPVFGEFNGESYFETAVHTFAATGGNFDKIINRLAIVNHATQVNGQIVVALSGTLPTELLITPETPEEDRSFKYRIYGR